ncbi:opioid-binding protein/cell adhesion molecule homolog [Tubulanus polymorphus]|uniref:opioid-binding protein/cell adhesion molecule homolog n=1 Tax=Tubulanus polymorphus TaxID=672921 RepID=UPI003DA66980
MDSKVVFIILLILPSTTRGCFRIPIQKHGHHNAIGLKPSFDVPEATVTVVAAQTVVLPCSINDLGDFQVIWQRRKNNEDRSLTVNGRRITDDTRMSVDRPFKKEWNLSIRNVRMSDEGVYLCSVNTDPVTSKMIKLTVNYAPRLQGTVSQVIVSEGNTLRLICNATGSPTPRVTWYRISDTNFGHDEKIKYTAEGEVLVIHNATRYCQDIYECVADNGVGPQASHQTKVIVHYAPRVHLPNKWISQSVGKMTILECEISANPLAGSYWLKEVEEIGSSKKKYDVQMYDTGDSEKVLSLTIHSVQKEDFGEYTCVSENTLGHDAKSMILEEYVDPALLKTTTTTTTTTTEAIEANMIPDGHSRKLITSKPQADSPPGKSPQDPDYNRISVESRVVKSSAASIHIGIAVKYCQIGFQIVTVISYVMHAGYS